LSIALYRKYRPGSFSEIVGQDAIAKTLKNQVLRDKVAHAYIFTGMRGTGKTSFAKILAKAVNCRSRQDGDPCGKCDICLGIDDGSILDVIEIDAASNSGVDNIRELKEETAYSPAVTDMRVYIIDEVHMLSTGAFNALLKIMEDPPLHVLFILATTEAHKVPATVLSRCQRFDLDRVKPELITGHLLSIAEKENISITEGAAKNIAILSEGSLRDALSILDAVSSLDSEVNEETLSKYTGTIDKSYLQRIAEYISKKDLENLLLEIDSALSKSINVDRLVTELMSYYRNLLVAKTVGENAAGEFFDEGKEEYLGLSDDYETDQLISILDDLKSLYERLAFISDKRLLLEVTLIGSLGKTHDTVEKKSETATRPTHVKNKKKEKTDDSRQTETSQRSVPKTSDNTDESAEAEFKEWVEVIEAMKNVNSMLYGFMKGSRAYITKTHLLIECSEAFKSYLRDNRQMNDQIKQVVLETTGLKMPIGPYEKSGTEENEKEIDMPESLEKFIDSAMEKGVSVTVE
jgi:DNA polymerase-3 subunit gamma/tau